VSGVIAFFVTNHTHDKDNIAAHMVKSQFHEQQDDKNMFNREISSNFDNKAGIIKIPEAPIMN
jgi:hypothetical protein